MSASPPAPSATAATARPPALGGVTWRANLALFLATVASCYLTQALASPAVAAALEGPADVRALVAALFARDTAADALRFTGVLLTILTAHELGHWIAARVHRVDATLPYFIPMPLLSPFGTMGAVIRMKGVIPTRRALLDIGASGPLAGAVFAIPLYAWGVSRSTLVPLGGGGFQLGESLLLRALDHAFGPAKAPGMDIALAPEAYAAWAGLFVTMINLMPAGQLDGGHVAHALFGTRQDRIAPLVHRSMLALFFVNLGSFALRDARAGRPVLANLGEHVTSSAFWLVWFVVLAVLGSLGRSASERKGPSTRTRVVALLGLLVVPGLADAANPLVLWPAWAVALGLYLAMEARGGALTDASLVVHPRTGSDPLDARRAAVAVITLLLFVATFMPTPIHP